MTLSAVDFAGLVVQANLAPSVHNTQPTRWRLLPDGGVLVMEDAGRRLAVGDRLGRDAMVSHGAAIEGFALACGPARSISVRIVPPAQDDALRAIARLDLADRAAPDPLAGALASRRTYRGKFAAAACGDALDRLEGAQDVRLVRDHDGIDLLARLNDAASLRTMRDAAFRAELLSWMRLSRRDPGWPVDGLNAEALQMSGAEAAAAGVVLRPGVFAALDRMGLAGPLTSDAEVVRSAAAIALFHRPAGDDLLQVGRRYHRFWLELAVLGLSAAPMSVLADDRQAHAAVAQAFDLPAGRTLVTAFRVGVAPPAPVTPKPRLPASVLVV